MDCSMARAFICGGLFLLMNVAASAQRYGYPPNPGDPYYAEPRYSRPYEGRSGEDVFEHVEDDLNRAAFDVYGSHRHINHARKEVEDVLRELNRGKFDRDEMGEAISAVEHVVNKDSLPEADRSMLWRDTAQMRSFRDRSY